MAKTRGVTQRQINLIKYYSRKGRSANWTVRHLRARGIGMRRQKLLGYVREFKGQPSRPHVEKYTRTRYRRKPSVGFPQVFPKRVILRGRWKGKTKEIEKTGEGRDLYGWVKDNMIEAKRREGWDSKPQVMSR